MSRAQKAVQLVSHVVRYGVSRIRILGHSSYSPITAELRLSRALDGPTYFLLAQLLSTAGYRVRIAPSFRLLSYLSNPSGRLITQRSHLKVGRRKASATLIISDDPLDPDADIYLDYDYFGAIYRRGEKDSLGRHVVGIPIGFDPYFLDRPASFGPRVIHSGARTTRLAFVGGSRQAAYNRDRQADCFDVVVRHRALELLKSGFAEAAVSEKRSTLLSHLADPRRRIVLATPSARLRPDEWPRLLSAIDCFLCLPGSQMPISQNLVEAMAVGTVPVLEYSDLMDPPLTDGENCITYRGEAGLTEAVERVLGITGDELERLRRGVVEYYATALSPQGIATRLDTAVRTARLSDGRVEVFLNLEEASIRLFRHSHPGAMLPNRSGPKGLSA